MNIHCDKSKMNMVLLSKFTFPLCHKISLCSPGSPETCYVAQVMLEFVVMLGV